MTTHISAYSGRNIIKWIGACFLLMLTLLCFVFYYSYHSRRDLCQQIKRDLALNARGWRGEEDQAVSNSRPSYARLYAQIAVTEELRAKVDCQTIFSNLGEFP